MISCRLNKIYTSLVSVVMSIVNNFVKIKLIFVLFKLKNRSKNNRYKPIKCYYKPIL